LVIVNAAHRSGRHATRGGGAVRTRPSAHAGPAPRGAIAGRLRFAL